MRVIDLRKFINDPNLNPNDEVTIPLSDDRIEVRAKDRTILATFMIFDDYDSYTNEENDDH